MKRKILTLIGAVFIIAALMLLVSCSDSPYGELSDDGYGICVKFDANGGDFANNGKYMTIVDVYKMTPEATSSGIKIYAPDDKVRQPEEIRFDVTKSMSKFQFAGWFPVKTNENGEILDTEGNIYKPGSDKQPQYLSDTPWDFENGRLKVEEGKTYTRENPALTLIAKWVSHTTFKFWVKNASGEWEAITKGGEELTYKGITVQLPRLNVDESEKCTDGYGNWTFYNTFNPKGSDQIKPGKTFTGAYLDPKCTLKISQNSYKDPYEFSVSSYLETHPDFDTADGVINIYTTWESGNWFNVYTADQFSIVFASILDGTLTKNGTLTEGGISLENGGAPLGVKIRLMADLDFSDTEYGWLCADPNSFLGKKLDYESFDGLDLFIDGNSHSFKNIDCTASDTSKYGGIFKKLSALTNITNLKIENSTFTVSTYKGGREDSIKFGFLAGEIADGATVDVELIGCTVKIGSTLASKLTGGTMEIYAGAPGNSGGIDHSGVSIEAPAGLTPIIHSDGSVAFEKTNTQEDAA